MATLQYPGSAFTAAAGINARGDIVGNYRVGSAQHAFTLVNGVYANADVPGAIATLGSGINSSGDIAGDYVTADGVTHGLILSGGDLMTVDVPGAVFTFVRGITPGAHRAMGTYSMDNKVFHGFLLENGELTTHDYPGAATNTVFDVNTRGDFVGDFGDTVTATVFHGYVCRQ